MKNIIFQLIFVININLSSTIENLFITSYDLFIGFESFTLKTKLFLKFFSYIYYNRTFEYKKKNFCENGESFERKEVRDSKTIKLAELKVKYLASYPI